MEKELIERGYIPLDKSWINRMGVLDMVNGRAANIFNFLERQNDLGDDMLALKRAAKLWNTDAPVDVGESGTLYRLLKFASWKLGLNKRFVIHGTLKQRNITDKPDIVGYSQRELLKLDDGTSQWATAAVLLGDPERLPADEAPFKLKLAYEAVDYWKKCQAEGKNWEPRYDQTILKQAIAYLCLLNGKGANFIPEQSEDFCFAYAFGFITAEEGDKKWPNLRGNESDRVKEMQKVMIDVKEGGEVVSMDHRVVQAAAMWGKVHNKKISVAHPEAVNKSWPQFWHFIEAYSRTK